MSNKHGEQAAGFIHVIPNWKPADATALAAITPASADEEGKFAWQLDTDEVYMLIDYTGPTWVLVGGGVGVQGPGSSTNNGISTWDGTGGDTLQDTGITIDDSDNMVLPTGNLTLTAGDINMTAGDVNMADNIVERPELKDYGITHNAQASVSGAAAIDLETGNSQKITVTGNITSMAFNNPPASGIDGSLTLYVVQGGTGSYTIVWPTSVDWPGGTGPTISTAVGSVDIYVFKTIDGGTTWFGAQIGADFQ